MFTEGYHSLGFFRFPMTYQFLLNKERKHADCNLYCVVPFFFFGRLITFRKLPRHDLKINVIVHTYKRADNNNKIKHIPCFLKVTQLQCNNLDYGFQQKYPSKDEIGHT